ncbi:MAG: Smr/MutS family protein [Flavobacteriales bacterium]|nr:Smr/MutS family protein [Flavobacteriales bacterium]
MECSAQIEFKIGFERIRDLLLVNCRNPGSKELVDRIQPTHHRALISEWLDQTREFKQILEEGNGPTLLIENPLESAFDKLALSNNFLDVEELLQIRDLAMLGRDLYAFFDLNAARYPALQACVEQCELDEHIVRSVDKLFTETGEWRWNASKKLQELHHQEEQTARSIQRHVQSEYKKLSEAGYLAETDLTIRNGRLVLPVIAEHKRRVNGLVHDVSGNGRIFYIEPLGALQSSNELTEIRLAIGQEQRRLLRKLCNELRIHLSDLKMANNRIVFMEFVRSKAMLALDLQAIAPILSENAEIQLVKARHPLLYLSHRSKDLPIVPLSLHLAADNRILLISGPNAGGKSVALKTVALLQYMLQCGLLIPCDGETRMGVFHKLFVDIGDDQSIDNDLSSYSSHLQNMKSMLEAADPDTLICIDEIGVGTDPQFGGALAATMIEELARSNCRGIVTTHYGLLKTLADQTDGILNGRMNFDADDFKPLFTLEIGKPGSSFAFEVAERIGLPPDLIEASRKYVNTKQEKTDRLLAQLDKEKSELELITESVRKEQEALLRLKSDYQTVKKELEKGREEILTQARKKALQIIEKANADVERAVKRISDAKQDRQLIKKIREGLEAEKAELTKKVGKSAVKKDEVSRPIRVGDRVRIAGSEAWGQVMEIRKDKAVVVAGIIKTTIALNDLSLVPEKKIRMPEPKANVGQMIVDRGKEFKLEQDVRGMRMDEALKFLDDWIDNALMLGHYQLRLIHGKGDGILKQAIRNHLKGKKYVRSIQYEHIELGGEGVSLIELQ